MNMLPHLFSVENHSLGNSSQGDPVLKTSIRSILTFVALATALFFPSTGVSAQETGDLKITFKYGGDEVPELKDINVTADAAYCGKHNLKDPSLIVNPENKGIANVIVYIYTKRNDPKIDAPKSEPKIVELANKGCQFVPHVVITQAGDTLKVTNPDEVGHNANLQFFNNKAQNPTIPAGKSVEVQLEKAEPAPIPVACNIHPWMKGFIVVLDHPYAAVSDENGTLTIKGLPAGKKLVFRANHESAKIKEVQIDGKTEKWKRSRFEVEIKPGMNDLGEVVIGADQFR